MGDVLAALGALSVDKKLYIPALVTWMASMGGATHEPVTQFFYLEIGASTSDVGYLNSCGTLGTLLLAPIFGWAIDNELSHIGMTLCAACCAIGCLVRSMATSVSALYLASFVIGLGANLWGLVLAYIATANHASLRSVIISGYIGLQRIAGLVGKGLYPLLNEILVRVLKIEDKLVRFRLTMSLCTIFCFFGVYLLFTLYYYRLSQVLRALCCRKKLGRPAAESLGDEPAVIHPPDLEPDVEMVGKDSCKRETKEPPETSNWFAFAVIAIAIAGQAAFAAIFSILWPLYLHKVFRWDTEHYSLALLFASVATIAGVLVHPAAERKLGQHVSASLALIMSAVVSDLAFIHTPEFGSTSPAIIHTCFAILLAFLLGLADSSLKSLATFQMPSSLQGRAWGVLTSIHGLGTITGSSLGGNLFKSSPYLPFWICGAFLFMVAVFLQTVTFCTTLTEHKHYSTIPTNTDTSDRNAHLAAPNYSHVSHRLTRRQDSIPLTKAEISFG